MRWRLKMGGHARLHARFLGLALGLALLLGGGTAWAQDGRLTVWSGVMGAQLDAVFADFTAATGLVVSVESDDPDRLLGRLASDPHAADVVILPGLHRLDRAAAAGLFTPTELPTAAEKGLPAGWHDRERRWVGLAHFARIIVYRPGQVRAAPVRNYAGLGQPELRGRICASPAGRGAALVLTAGMIRQIGADETRRWIERMVRNLAQTPPGDDTGLLRALDAKGGCDYALVSSPVLARLAESREKEDRRLLARLDVLWPDQRGGGTRLDVIGGGRTAGGDGANPDGARRLLAWLLGETGQRRFAAAAYAYPLRPGVPLSNAVTRFGPFRADPATPDQLVPLLGPARQMVEQAGWP